VPQAVQVADRWHLMENASAAFLEAVRRSMRQIRIAIGSTTIDPALLTHAERLQHEGYLRQEEAMTSSEPWPRPARRSRRSGAGRDAAANWCAISFAAIPRTWFCVEFLSCGRWQFLSRFCLGSVNSRGFPSPTLICFLWWLSVFPPGFRCAREGKDQDGDKRHVELLWNIFLQECEAKMGGPGAMFNSEEVMAISRVLYQ
jgi:hypothetical protein